MGYHSSTLHQVAVFNSTPGGNGGAVWAGGQGLAADVDNVYAMTANGTFDANSGGRDYGDSVLKLGTSSALSLADYFTPGNQSFLSGHDVDLGSGGPLLLPGTNLLVGIGKDGIARLIDTSNMGEFNALVNKRCRVHRRGRILRRGLGCVLHGCAGLLEGQPRVRTHDVLMGFRRLPEGLRVQWINFPNDTGVAGLNSGRHWVVEYGCALCVSKWKPERNGYRVGVGALFR